MKYGIFIGQTASAVKAFNKAVLQILNTKADQETIRLALQTLSSGLRVENTSISDVNITTQTPLPSEIL